MKSRLVHTAIGMAGASIMSVSALAQSALPSGMVDLMGRQKARPDPDARMTPMPADPDARKSGNVTLNDGLES